MMSHFYNIPISNISVQLEIYLYFGFGQMFIINIYFCIYNLTNDKKNATIPSPKDMPVIINFGCKN